MVKGDTSIPFTNIRVAKTQVWLLAFRLMCILFMLFLAYMELYGDKHFATQEEHDALELKVVKNTEDVTALKTHASDRNIHMSYQEKMDVFLPRREFQNYKQQTGEQLKSMDHKLDKLIDLQLKR